MMKMMVTDKEVVLVSLNQRRHADLFRDQDLSALWQKSYSKFGITEGIIQR